MAALPYDLLHSVIGSLGCVQTQVFGLLAQISTSLNKIIFIVLSLCRIQSIISLFDKKAILLTEEPLNSIRLTIPPTQQGSKSRNSHSWSQGHKQRCIASDQEFFQPCIPFYTNPTNCPRRATYWTQRPKSATLSLLWQPELYTVSQMRLHHTACANIYSGIIWFLTSLDQSNYFRIQAEYYILEFSYYTDEPINHLSSLWNKNMNNKCY